MFLFSWIFSIRRNVPRQRNGGCVSCLPLICSSKYVDICLLPAVCEAHRNIMTSVLRQRPVWVGIYMDFSHVIGRDGHLYQSHGWHLGQHAFVSILNCFQLFQGFTIYEALDRTRRPLGYERVYLPLLKWQIHHFLSKGTTYQQFSRKNELPRTYKIPLYYERTR